MAATVLKVTSAAKEIFYNVALNIASNEEVKAWYTTPGQYIAIKVLNGPSVKSAYFFMASAPREAVSGFVEFLIHEYPDTTASDLIDSSAGAIVELTQLSSPAEAFDLRQLYPVTDVQTVLLFASGYGLGPIRALIETGFRANERKYVVLYLYYGSENQRPYKDEYTGWEKSGVKVQAMFKDSKKISIGDGLNSNDFGKACAVLCGSQKLQQKWTEILLQNGMPQNKILTCFNGYLEQDMRAKGEVDLAAKVPKVLAMGDKHLVMGPKFLAMGDKYVHSVLSN